MKRILVAAFLILAATAQIYSLPARAGELRYPVFDRLALPDSMLPPGYELSPGRAWPKHEANPLVTIDSDIIGFICTWFMLGLHDTSSVDNDLDREGEDAMEAIERFNTALSSYVRAGYLAMYLPQRGSDEIGIMALLLKPDCDMLDGLHDGVFMNNLLFMKIDSLAVYAFTDIQDETIMPAIHRHFERQLGH